MGREEVSGTEREELRARGPSEAVVWFLKGTVIGLANIIPGVSGGTMALVLGIYTRLIRAVGRFGPSSLRQLGAALRDPRRAARLARWWREHDLSFLSAILAGVLAAIVATSRLMEYLLGVHHAATYGFFFGLVAASVVFPWSLLRRRGWPELFCALVAVVITVGLTELMSPEDRLEAAREKETLREARAAAPAAPAGVALAPGGRPIEGPVAPAGPSQPLRAAILCGVGALAISAMVLPGISGSFILLLLGYYFEVLRAINRRDWLVLLSFGAGCLLGLLLFVKLLDWLLTRFYSPTLAFLGGLMVGSLWNLWPYQRGEVIGERTIWLESYWPRSLGEGQWLPAATAALGAAIVLGFFAYEVSTRTSREVTEESAVAR